MKKEIVNHVVTATMLKKEFASPMMQTVRHMLGLIAKIIGPHLGLKENHKPANIVMMASISIRKIFVNNCLAIVKKRNQMELALVVKMDLT